MIALVALLTYRDGGTQDHGMRVVEMATPAPDHIEVFPSTRYRLVNDRSIISYSTTYDRFAAVYLLDHARQAVSA